MGESRYRREFATPLPEICPILDDGPHKHNQKRVTRRDWAIVRAYVNDPEATLTDVAKQFGLSPQRVGQIVRSTAIRLWQHPDCGLYMVRHLSHRHDREYPNRTIARLDVLLGLSGEAEGA